MRHILLILSLALLLFAGCRHTATDPAIQRAGQLADTLPAQTLAILDSIDSSALTGHDLFLHQFLTVKARDKQFITHTSDSLLLLALDYAENHRSSVNYPEVLYYAGRVYTDIGDYPTALDYYHQALDEIPENHDLELRAKVLSNISTVYYACFLYDEAAQYLRQSMKIDSILCDTLNLIYDLTDLSQICYYCQDYQNSAEVHKQALALAEIKYPELTAEQYVDIARIKMQIGEIDSALLYIRDNVYNVDPNTSGNHALATAAEIYLSAGIPDTAYMYANELMACDDPLCKSRAYTVLLNPALADYVPRDSIYPYSKAIIRSTRKSLDKNGSKLTLIKSSQYNYDIHKRERIIAEQHFQKLFKWSVTGVIVILIALIIILFMRLKNKQQKLNLFIAESKIKFLTAELTKQQISEQCESEDLTNRSDFIRENLLIQAKKLASQDEFGYIQTLQKLTSRGLMEKLNNNELIPDDSHHWDELLETIMLVSPRFKDNLEILIGEPAKKKDLHTAILIKYGISPTSISRILGRSKQAINSRREKLGSKIFGESVRISEVDALIRVL